MADEEQDDSEEEDEESETEEDGKPKRRTSTVVQRKSLGQRRSSLTFAFAIIGAMLVLRHHWFGTAVKWVKAPVQKAQQGATDVGNQQPNQS